MLWRAGAVLAATISLTAPACAQQAIGEGADAAGVRGTALDEIAIPRELDFSADEPSDLSVGNLPFVIAVVANDQRRDQLLRSAAAGAGTDFGDQTGAGFGFGVSNGALSLIQQIGVGNRAFTSSVDSAGSSTAIIQGGGGNEAAAEIEDSPNSAILIAQLGGFNTAVAEIRRGSDNGIAISQTGNNHTAGVSLVDSVGTTVLYGQIALEAQVDGATIATSPNGQTGAYVIRNAPRGTVVRLGNPEETTQ